MADHDDVDGGRAVRLTGPARLVLGLNRDHRRSASIAAALVSAAVRAGTARDAHTTTRLASVRTDPILEPPTQRTFSFLREPAGR